MKKFFALFALVSLCAFAFTGCNTTQSAQTAKQNALTQLSAEDVTLLLKGESPQVLQQAASNPQQYLEPVLKSLREILAIAAQARKDGLANEPDIKKELEFSTAQVLAYEFEREQSKANPGAQPFASIKAEEVEAFYKEPNKENDYNSFLEVVKKRYAETPQGTAQAISDEQLKQIRDGYAKVFLTERKARAAGFDKKREVQLQIAVQEASYLAGEINKRKVKDFEVSDAALNEYIAAHPEYDSQKKRAVAEEILKRVKAGEDFNKLANELSEDPGNKDPKTGKGTQGGLYESVKKGQFIPQFEAAALALEPGKVTDGLVETPYGFHIIKLENKKTEKAKDGSAEETYSVRHILISTMTAPDPANPMAQPKNMKDAARDKVKQDMREKWLAGVIAQNPITLPKAEEVKIEVPAATPGISGPVGTVPSAPPAPVSSPSPAAKTTPAKGKN